MTLPKTYYINIQIYNEHGELLDKRLAFGSNLAEVQNKFEGEIHKLFTEAHDNGSRDGMLYEELYDSKEDAELAKEDTL